MSRSRWQAVSFSLVLHLAVLAAGVFSISLSAPLAVPQQLAIQATVVDASVLDNLDNARAEAALEAQRQREQRLLRERQAQQELQQRQTEQQEAERRASEALAAQEEADKKAEAQRIADEKAALVRAEQEREAKQQAERDALRRAEEEKLAELKRKKEAEEKRIADEKRAREEAQARKQREEEARREAEAEALFLAQLEEEERRMSAARAGLLVQYRNLIKQQITRNWIRPPSAQQGLECVVYVTQIPSREVVDVRVADCNGDAATVRSIEVAVYRASPLPAPPDPALFERKLTITFKPDA